MATKRRKTEPAADKRCVVNYLWGLNLRSGPGVEFPVIRVLPDGTEVTARAPFDGEWIAVEDGWAMAIYLREV